MSTIVGERVAAPAPPRATLRRQLLISLLAPIVLVTLVSAVVSYYYAFNFANLAYDNSLFDSALDISRQTRVADGQVHVDLPSAALDMLQSDAHDSVYYMVKDAQGRFVSGHPSLPFPTEEAPPGKPIYYDGTYRGDPIRLAALYSQVAGASEGAPIMILVGETLNKRRALANEILLSMLLPELLLVVLVGGLVWYGVERGLRPLAELQKEIGSRSHRDLSPLPEHNAPGEVRSLIRAMNDLLARLSEALSAQQRFIADAAHQLRTPLAGLKTQTELALRQNELDAVRQTLTQLNAATGQTTHLVNQLLSLARAEPEANRAFVPQPVNLNEIVRDAAAEWVPRALARNIDLGFDGCDGATIVEGDALLIKEMLNNVLDNALRYTPPGGQVTARVSAERGRVLLGVEDNGPGIPAEERERVFERFHRVLGSGADGCGLGLAIVREIAQRHNAEVRLGSTLGGTGTLVTISFAVAR